MEPSKRCARCNKPIWDADYVSIWDGMLDAYEHIHGQCFERENQQRIDNLCEDAMTMETDFYR